MNKEELSNIPVLAMPDDIKPKPNYSNIARKAERLALVKAYLETPYKDRLSLPLFRKSNGLRRDVYLQLKYEVEENLKEVNRQRVRDAQRWMDASLGKTGSLACPEGAIGLEDDPMLWWKSRQVELNQAIYNSAVKGNPQSQKLAKQLAGELVEKQEIKIGLTAEERARRIFQAEEELKKEGYIGIAEGKGNC